VTQRPVSGSALKAEMSLTRGLADRFPAMTLTPEGCRAGRALLKGPTRDLAQRAGLACTTDHRIEARQVPRAGTEARLLATFAAAGVVILDGPQGVGAVLRRGD